MSAMTLPVTTSPRDQDLDAQTQAMILAKLAGFLGVEVGGGWVRVDLEDPGVWERIIPALRLLHGGHVDRVLEPRTYYVRVTEKTWNSDVTTERP